MAHSERLEDLRVRRPGKAFGAPAVFLSGNGPLVEVLQAALQIRAFVVGMKKFIDYYGFKRQELVPSEHVLIFDEAQRAWDAAHMESKHGRAISEPEMLLQIACRIPESPVVVALVGEGQEINRGEEAGLLGWKNALAPVTDRAQWTVHGASHALDMFDAVMMIPNDLLNLASSLRSHLGSDLHQWVTQLLEATPETLSSLRSLAQSMRSVGFQLYATRDLDAAKVYARERYDAAREARYGLLGRRWRSQAKRRRLRQGDSERLPCAAHPGTRRGLHLCPSKLRCPLHGDIQRADSGRLAEPLATGISLNPPPRQRCLTPQGQ